MKKNIYIHVYIFSFPGVEVRNFNKPGLYYLRMLGGGISETLVLFGNYYKMCYSQNKTRWDFEILALL